MPPLYGKIFEQIYEGSLYGQWEALVTFQQLIVLAEYPDGVVDMTPAAIAARTSIPLDIIQRGIAILELPDAESRTPDESGRRIVRLAEGRTWGWRITNYPHYNAIRTAEERREYMRLYQQARRAAKREASTDVNVASTPVSNVNPVAIAVDVAIPPAKTGGRKKKANVGTLEAGELVNAIRAATAPTPQGTTYIDKAKVVALGDDVLRAYTAIGGSKRFLVDDKYTLRDFTAALREVRAS